MSTRCPYCHCDLTDRAPRTTCLSCAAPAHPGCTLELARCAACGGEDFSAFGAGDVDGWRLIEAGLSPSEPYMAFLEVLPRDLLQTEETLAAPVSLRLDLLRREVTSGALLAGEAVLTVPAPTRLGSLTLELREERAWSGLFGVKRKTRLLRRARLLGAPPPSSLLSRLFASPADLYAPGVYRIRFRVPLQGVAPTEEVPGQPQLRITATLRLERPEGALWVGLEVRVLAVELGAGKELVGDFAGPRRRWLRSWPAPNSFGMATMPALLDTPPALPATPMPRRNHSTNILPAP